MNVLVMLIFVVRVNLCSVEAVSVRVMLLSVRMIGLIVLWMMLVVVSSSSAFGLSCCIVDCVGSGVVSICVFIMFLGSLMCVGFGLGFCVTLNVLCTIFGIIVVVFSCVFHFVIGLNIEIMLMCWWDFLCICCRLVCLVSVTSGEWFRNVSVMVVIRFVVFGLRVFR